MSDYSAWHGFQPLEERVLLSASGLSLADNPTARILYADDHDDHGHVEAVTVSLKQFNAKVGQSVNGGKRTLVNQNAKGDKGFDIVLNVGKDLRNNNKALAAFERAAEAWEAFFTDNITVYIDADLGDLGNSGIIGGALSTRVNSTYAEMRQKLVADAKDEIDDTVTKKLPKAGQEAFSTPKSFKYRGNVIGNKAAMKAAGFSNLDSKFGKEDGSIVFNSQFSFDYNNSNGVNPSKIDFETVALHEIGHVLGFVSFVDDIDRALAVGESIEATPSMMDLYRFAADTNNDPDDFAAFATATRELTPGVTAIFDQIEAWKGSNIENELSTGRNTGDGQQASHWKDDEFTNDNLGTLDPTLDFGVSTPLSDNDIRLYDLIGYDITGDAAPPVNEPPVANADTGATSEDAVLIVGAANGLLANDTDPEGKDIFAAAQTVTSEGGAVVKINADGSYRYDPTQSKKLQRKTDGQSMTDVFRYTLVDQKGARSRGAVTITIAGADDAPTAANDIIFRTGKNKTFRGDVTINDTHLDSDALKVTAITKPKRGKFTINPNGRFTFKPKTNGSNFFTYKATDANGNETTAVAFLSSKPQAASKQLIKAKDPNSNLGSAVLAAFLETLDDDDDKLLFV